MKKNLVILFLAFVILVMWISSLLPEKEPIPYRQMTTIVENTSFIVTEDRYIFKVEGNELIPLKEYTINKEGYRAYILKQGEYYYFRKDLEAYNNSYILEYVSVVNQAEYDNQMQNYN